MKIKHGKIDVGETTFSLDQMNEAEDAIRRGICNLANEALKELIESNQSYATLPAVWPDNDGFGGGPVDDPLTIYFVIGDECVVEANIRDYLEWEIAEAAEHASSGEGLLRIAATMREVADKIEQACGTSVTDS